MDRALPLDLVKRSPAEEDGAIVTEEVMLDAGAGGEGTRAAGRRAVLTEAFGQPRRELGTGLPLEALVSLVMTFNLGIIIERLGGIEPGHRELLDWIDQWISR